jgi:hypothetical protein
MKHLYRLCVTLITPACLPLFLVGVLFTVLGLPRPGLAQHAAPGWTTAQAIVPMTASFGPTSISGNQLDQAGNRYEYGTFKGTLVVGDTVLTSQASVSSTYWDAYIIKRDPSGAVTWVRQLKSPGLEEIRALEVDKAGYVYIAGQTTPAVNGASSGSMEVGNGLTVVSNAFAKVFLVRYSPRGKPEWVRQNAVADKDYPFVEQVRIAADGVLYLTGYYSNTFTFANGQLPNPTFKSYMHTASFESQTGAPRFLRHAVEWGSGNWMTAPVVGTAGGSYYASFITKTAITLNGVTYQAGGGNQILLVRYRSTGTIEWVCPVARSLKDGGLSQLQTDEQGNVYAVGYFSGTLTVGTGPQQTTFSNTGRLEALVLKVTATGQLAWAHSLPAMTSYAASQYTDLALSPAGEVCVTGSFEGMVEAGADCLVSIGKRDVVVGTYSLQGQPHWFQRAGSANRTEDRTGGYTVVPQASGQIWTLGRITVPATFGAVTMATPNYLESLFLAKLSAEKSPPARCVSSTLAAFPNPATTWLYLPALPLPAAVELLDALGRRVYYTAQLTTCRLPLEQLASGWYLLRATTPEGCQYSTRVEVAK